jgi:hypothetical protein
MALPSEAFFDNRNDLNVKTKEGHSIVRKCNDTRSVNDTNPTLNSLRSTLNSGVPEFDSVFKSDYLCDMNSLKTIEKKIYQLTPDLVTKLDDYIDYLLSRKKVNKSSKLLKQDWAGGLKDYKNNYTSIELQKLALVWRTK